MNNKLKQIIYGGFIAAIILTLLTGCQFGSKSTGTVNNNSVQNTNSAPVSNQSVKTKNKYFWGGWDVQNNKKYPKTQFVFDMRRGLLVNHDFGNDEPPDDKLEEGKYDYIDRQTIKITMSDGKSMTAKLSSEGDTMTVDNYKGESLTMNLYMKGRMKYYVCTANPKSCDENYPFDK